jgi:hypothetical protein
MASDKASAKDLQTRLKLLIRYAEIEIGEGPAPPSRKGPIR